MQDGKGAVVLALDESLRDSAAGHVPCLGGLRRYRCICHVLDDEQSGLLSHVVFCTSRVMEVPCKLYGN